MSFYRPLVTVCTPSCGAAQLPAQTSWRSSRRSVRTHHQHAHHHGHHRHHIFSSTHQYHESIAHNHPLYQFYQHHHLHHDNIHPHYPLTIKFIPSIITMMVAFHIIMVSFFTIILDYIVLMIISVIFPRPIHNKHHPRYTSPAIKSRNSHSCLNQLAFLPGPWLDGWLRRRWQGSFFSLFLFVL